MHFLAQETASAVWKNEKRVLYTILKIAFLILHHNCLYMIALLFSFTPFFPLPCSEGDLQKGQFLHSNVQGRMANVASKSLGVNLSDNWHEIPINDLSSRFKVGVNYSLLLASTFRPDIFPTRNTHLRPFKNTLICSKNDRVCKSIVGKLRLK